VTELVAEVEEVVEGVELTEVVVVVLPLEVTTKYTPTPAMIIITTITTPTTALEIPGLPLWETCTSANNAEFRI
jgi:hypothetical protein